MPGLSHGPRARAFRCARDGSGSARAGQRSQLARGRKRAAARRRRPGAHAISSFRSARAAGPGFDGERRADFRHFLQRSDRGAGRRRDRDLLADRGSESDDRRATGAGPSLEVGRIDVAHSARGSPRRCGESPARGNRRVGRARAKTTTGADRSRVGRPAVEGGPLRAHDGRRLSHRETAHRNRRNVLRSRRVGRALGVASRRSGNRQGDLLPRRGTPAERAGRKRSMIARAVLWCARHHWFVVVAALILAGAGEVARRALRGDVVPDLSDPQIGLVVDWMGNPAPDVAAQITSVLTDVLRDLPGVKAVRGSTMTGMAYVDVVLDSASGLDDTRRAIAERVAAARSKLPPHARVQLGPAASSTGWVFEYALVDPGHVSSLLELRRFQEDVIKPALVSIAGVAEVASVGGGLRQIRIDTKPRELRARGLAFSDVLAALKPVLSRERGKDQVPLDMLEATSVGGASSEGVRIADVARVRIADDMQSGLADVGGYPAVGGIVIARRDADLGKLIDEVKRTLDRLRGRLPHRDADPERIDSGAAAAVLLLTVYDRSDLVTRVHQTLLHALGEEVGVVVFVILLFLLHGRSAIVPLVTLPVVLALTFGVMWILGVPATIMSLGGIGIALGMAVDADVVALEASHRRLERIGQGTTSEERRTSIVRAAQSFAPAILTSLVITALSFLPVFAFSGETGRLLRPLALTKTLVIASAGVVTLTLAPALRDLAFRGNVIPEFDNPLTRWLVRLYRPFVHFALARPALTLATAALAVGSCLPILSKLGGEFLPRTDEGDLLFMPTTRPGAPPDQAAVQLFWQDYAMSHFGEVDTVFGKIGRADTGTDPAPYSMAETTIRLRPRAEWPTFPRTRWYSTWAPEPLKRVLRYFWPDMVPRTTKELADKLDQTARLPGWQSAWTAPARARMDMMATGVRTPVGIRIVSLDPTRLDALGTAVRAVVARVPGTRSAVFESLGGETWLSFAADPAALALHGVDP